MESYWITFRNSLNNEESGASGYALKGLVDLTWKYVFIWPQTEEGDCLSIYFRFLAEQRGLGLAGNATGLRLPSTQWRAGSQIPVYIVMH